MRQITVGVVDYEIGNHASIVHCLRKLGFRVRISADPDVLDATNILVLPGVGAFPAAMDALQRRGLITYLQDKARNQKPIIGICLGMQLLATSSTEMQHTAGLDIIPGNIVPIAETTWHIGWNTMECVHQDPLFQPSDGEAFYFNHSYCYRGPHEYEMALSRHGGNIPVAIRRGKTVGLQFHPEKSQKAGRTLLLNMIAGLVHA